MVTAVACPDPEPQRSVVIAGPSTSAMTLAAVTPPYLTTTNLTCARTVNCTWKGLS